MYGAYCMLSIMYGCTFEAVTWMSLFVSRFPHGDSQFDVWKWNYPNPSFWNPSLAHMYISLSLALYMYIYIYIYIYTHTHIHVYIYIYIIIIIMIIITLAIIYIYIYNKSFATLIHKLWTQHELHVCCIEHICLNNKGCIRSTTYVSNRRNTTIVVQLHLYLFMSFIIVYMF